MAKFLSGIVEGLKKAFQNDTLWSAAVSWFDPEIRRWAEECALAIRERAASRGIVLSETAQRQLAERTLASLRGVFERLANNHVQSKPMVVILEKVFNDIPDFMAAVLFSDEHEFQMWLQLRAERGLALASKRGVLIEDIAIGEKEFDIFYAEVRKIAEETLGQDAVIPEGLIERSAERLQQALRGEFVPKEKIFEPMSAAAGRLKIKMEATLGKLLQGLEWLFHVDPEQARREREIGRAIHDAETDIAHAKVRRRMMAKLAGFEERRRRALAKEARDWERLRRRYGNAAVTEIRRKLQKGEVPPPSPPPE
ncbi:MAG: hypothetical protein PHV43_02730 [Candidatus Colwellbacteria bacterium]|nr:hypothetical protein [Candidatus Colwellbacteria bacterium]